MDFNTGVLGETPTDEPDQLILPNPEGGPWSEAPKKVYPRSVSQLKLYRQCSLSWKLQKYDGIKNQPAAWLPQGTAFGYVAQVWEMSRREMTEVEQKEQYYDCFDEEVAKYKDVQPDLSKWLVMGRTKIENDLKNRRDRGWDQWVVYRDRAVREPWKVWEQPDGSPGVEVKFYIDLGFGPIRGAVDIVKEWPDATLSVNDLKTGNREKTAIQLAVYAVALNEQFELAAEGKAITRGSFYYAKDDTYSRQFDLTPLGLDHIREEFEAMERGIEARVFNANVGDHCGLCPAKGSCPEYNSVQ